MSFILRDYQESACDAVEQQFLFGESPSTMIEMATGLGKTICFVEISRRFNDTRTLVICPMTTLLAQAADKFRRHTGEHPDIEQADLWANESEYSRSQVVVASTQSLLMQRNGVFRYERFKDIGLVVVDECHRSITSRQQRMLQYFLDHGACLLGVTATAGKGLNGLSMQNVYQTCCYQYGITEAVPDGWLVGCKANLVRVQSMDLSGVTTRAGDFCQDELNEILEQEKVMLEIADVVARESGSMKTAIYCSSVIEAKGVAQILADRYKLKAAFICADERQCSKQRRKEVLDSFTKDKNGIQFVANVGVLTTGWDFPGLEHIVMARPTKSPKLYIQIFGRGTRPLEGVVDFEGSTCETRLAAIAASPKPCFHMTDLVDNSLEHKIVTSADVMGGKLGLEVIALAKKKMLAGGCPVSLDEALLDAKQQLDREREELERRRREFVRGRAEYVKSEVDVHDPYGRGIGTTRTRTPVMLFGKHKGKLLTQVPLSYLQWMHKNLTKLRPWFRSALANEIRARTGRNVA